MNAPRECKCPDALCVHESVPEQRLAEAMFGDASAPTADPDRACYHPDVDLIAGFGRIGEDDADNPLPGMPTAFMIEVSLSCKACAEVFVFDGVPAGMSYDAPAVSVDGQQLRAPVRPISLPPRHRRGIAGVSGFRIDVHRPDDDAGGSGES